MAVSLTRGRGWMLLALWAIAAGLKRLKNMKGLIDRWCVLGSRWWMAKVLLRLPMRLVRLSGLATGGGLPCVAVLGDYAGAELGV